MRTPLSRYLVLLCLFAFPVAYSEPLTLQQALERATTSNPGLQATRARLGVTEAEIITAGARPNPSIVSDNGIAEKTYRLGIEQTFQLGGKRRKQVSLAQAQRDVLLAEINTAILDLRTDVRRAYTRLFNAQQRLQAAEEIVATNERLMTVAQKREKAGAIANLDVQQAKVALLRAKNDAQVAHGEVIQARTALNVLLGQSLATAWELTSPSLIAQPQPPVGDTTLEPVPLKGEVSLQQADLEALVQEALARRPELQQNLREITVTERQLDVARANRIPDITIAAGPDLVVEDETELNAFVVASIPVPLFNRQQGPILEARARRTQLEAQQAALRNRIVSDVTNAYTGFTLNQERILRFETELLPTAQIVVNMSQRSFEVGKSNILVPLNAQQEYMQTRLDYLQALQDYQNAISDLERAVGTGL